MSDVPSTTISTGQWKLPVFVTTLVVLFCAMMSVQLFVTPSFETKYKQLGISHTLPGVTHFVSSGGGLGVSIVLFLLACGNVVRCKPGSSARTAAAWGAIAVGILCIVAMLMALNAPMPAP